MQLEYSEIIKWYASNYPNDMDRLFESLSPNQIKCKHWLVDALDNVTIPTDFNNKFKIEIIGGWFGFPLIDYLVQKYGDRIRGIDFFEIDEDAIRVLGRYIEYFGENNLPPIKIFNIDYFEYKETRRSHMIINTSCEHMQNMSSMKQYYITPERTLLVLQSNNKIDEPDHINCVKDIPSFVKQVNFRLLYDDIIKFDWWYRYMILGKWY